MVNPIAIGIFPIQPTYIIFRRTMAQPLIYRLINIFSAVLMVFWRKNRSFDVLIWKTQNMVFWRRTLVTKKSLCSDN